MKSCSNTHNTNNTIYVSELCSINWGCASVGCNSREIGCVSNWNSQNKMNASHIGLIVALDYLNFREVYQWEIELKNIVNWHKQVTKQLPGYADTFPKE